MALSSWYVCSPSRSQVCDKIAYLVSGSFGSFSMNCPVDVSRRRMVASLLEKSVLMSLASSIRVNSPTH